MPERGRLGILISGRGSNMQSLLRAMGEARIAAAPAVVISNVPDAPGLEAAARAGVRTVVLDHRELRPRERHDARVIEVLREQRVDLVCLAGYMRLLSAAMIAAFRDRIFNIHPSLLPAFPGLHAPRQALEHGAKVSGCTVHVVDEQLDHGPIVMQAAVPVLEQDTEESLAARILEQEHRIYPAAVAAYFAGRLRIEGRRVRIVDASAG
ncbi:MAG TPA: phosphoribosylglycinamide formyltransferase [Candidatus Polarisedimenticolaceae bacterium]|nr:phosphoribosylglycinamide formyltransferase [Candidatus Polarisedimenticolaceae bacterium]